VKVLSTKTTQAVTRALMSFKI